MKLLFDQCTPKGLREELPEHDVQTADELNIGGIENGQLIDEAVRRGYDLLVTADRRMQKQQDISGKPLRVVILTRPDWIRAKRQISEIRHAIATAEPGEFTRVVAARTKRQPQVTCKGEPLQGFRQSHAGRRPTEDEEQADSQRHNTEHPPITGAGVSTPEPRAGTIHPSGKRGQQQEENRHAGPVRPEALMACVASVASAPLRGGRTPLDRRARTRRADCQPEVPRASCDRS